MPFPRPCKGCSDAEKERWGCGYEGILGKFRYGYSGAEEPWNRTCPQFLAVQPAVVDVIDNVRDYKKGALGNVRELGSAYLQYLRIASAELAEWEDQKNKEDLERARNESKTQHGVQTRIR